MDELSRQHSEDSSTSTSIGPDVYYDAQVEYYRFRLILYILSVQESIEGRVSDAGLGASLQRMAIAGRNIETISKEYELHDTDAHLADLDHQDTINEGLADAGAFTEMNCVQEYCDEYCDSLEIFCPKRIASTQQALDQVADLMLKLENCENLFPSRRHLVATNATWGDEEFKMRFLYKS